MTERESQQLLQKYCQRSIDIFSICNLLVRLTIHYTIFRSLVTQYPSCIAATVAKQHPAKTMLVGSTKVKVNGNKNNANPVILFNTVCTDTNLFLQANPKVILAILIIAIALIHIHNQTGMCVMGNNLIKHTTIKIKSATVSRFEPKLLTAFVFFAIVPSIISVSPQNRQST